MTTFLGALPHPSSDSSTRFRLSADASPSVMPRIIGLFAKLAMVPEAFHAERTGEDGLEVEIRVAGLSAQQADHLARALRQIIEVEAVLVGLEEQAPAAARA
jgi:acetolactate synthase small subunit